MKSDELMRGFAVLALTPASSVRHFLPPREHGRYVDFLQEFCEAVFSGDIAGGGDDWLLHWLSPAKLEAVMNLGQSGV